MINDHILRELTTTGRENYLYNWSGIIKDESVIDIEKIYLRSFGPVDIPVSTEVINAVEERYSQSSYESSNPEGSRTCCSVDGSEVFIIPGNKKKLSEMLGNLTKTVLARMLDIDLHSLNVNLKTTLDQLLVICKSDQNFSRNLNNTKEPGTFGTLLMQIPINSPELGGQLVIKDKIHQTIVNLQKSNLEGFFVAAMAGTHDGSQSISIHSDGMVLMLIFNITWRDCTSLRWTWGLFPKYLLIAEAISKALRPWNNVSRKAKPQENNISDDNQASFLCFPLKNSYGTDPTSWNLTGQDLIISKIFAMLNFVDVNYAIIKSKYRQNLNNREADLFIFEKGHFTPNSIKDGLFNATINLKKHLISSNTLNGERFPVLVIRPRTLNFRLSQSLKDSLRPEAVLLDLEERMFEFSLADKSESNSISRDLELVLGSLQQLEGDFTMFHGTNLCGVYQQESDISCIKCFLYRLLLVCNRIRNASQGLRVLLHLSNLHDQSIFFRCHKCGVDLSNPNPVVVIANFIHQVAGWELSYTPLKMMLKRKLDENTYADFCDLGIKLVQGKCEMGGREIFNHVSCYLENHALKKFPIHEVSYSVQFFALAMELHKKCNDESAVQKAFKLFELTSPSSLTLLIDHLVDRLKNGLDTTSYLRGLGEIMAKKITPTFHVEHLLKILKIYQELNEEEILELLWTNICSQCIQVHNSEDCETANLKVTCLFCHLFLSTVDCDDLIKTLVNARNALDALGCSIDKITGLNSASTFHYREVLSYIRRIIELQDLLPVYFHPERMESFSSLFSCVHADDECLLIDSVLGLSRNSISREDSSVKCFLIERLISHLLNRKDLISTISRENVPKLMEFCFWYGDSNSMKNLLIKLDAFFASQPEPAKSLDSIISTILKANEASSRNCDLIRLLIWRRVKTLRSLKSGKVESFLDCFQVLFNAEKKLPNFAQGKVTLEFCKTISSLKFYDSLEILKSIFTCEYGEEINSSLKSLPTSLKIFSTLCNITTNAIDADKLTQVSVDSSVVLMQCYLWLGEEKPIVDFCRLLLSIPRTTFVDDVLEAIIFEENTADLAAGSPFGVVSLGDLIDRRIEHLTPTKNSMSFFNRFCPSRLSRSKSNSVFYVEPDKTYNGVVDGRGTLRKKIEQLTQYKVNFLKRLSDK